MVKITSTKRLTELEFRIIEKVKELRTKNNLSKMELSEAIGLANSFVGKVESYAHPDKYNFKHLNRIAEALKLKSIRELLPLEMPKFEDIEVVYEMIPKKNRDGSESKQLEINVIEIRPVE